MLFQKKKKIKNKVIYKRKKIAVKRNLKITEAELKKNTNRSSRKSTIKWNWKKTLVILLIFCFLGFAFWILFFSGVLNIKNIKIEGNVPKKLEIKSLVKKLEAEKFLYKFTKSNLILFSEKKLIEDIKREDISIRDVQVKKYFPDTLEIKVFKRKKIVLWQMDDKCFLLDDEANLLQQFNCSAKALESICQKKEKEIGLKCLVLRVKKVDNDLTEDELKQEKKEIEEAAFKIIDGLKKTFFYDDSVILYIPSFLSKELRVSSERYGELIFSLNDDIELQLKEFRALLEKKINISDLENMQYIDLRVKGKIIYRFKEGLEDVEENQE